MAYEYITDNNLYEKQTYMYSEYKGNIFLREYLHSRNNYLKGRRIDKEDDLWREVGSEENQVRQELQKICKNMENQNCEKEIIVAIDKYVKTFEVRKRIYTGYDNTWKPLKNAGFEDYESYLLFADCLLSAYQHTKCLKYFNCLLKLDDTLLSVQDRLGDSQKEFLCHIIRDELDVFYQIARENGIDGEMGT